MAVGYGANPELCPTTPLHITVDDKGFTRPGPGQSNAQVCLKANVAAFYPFVLKRLALAVAVGECPQFLLARFPEPLPAPIIKMGLFVFPPVLRPMGSLPF